MINGSNNRFNGKMFGIRLLIILIAISYAENSVVRLDDDEVKSLYDANDKVFVLTGANFYQTVYNQPYASHVEFYNSFCGHCRDFAPIYKAFAADMHDWSDIVRVSAINCAEDVNNDVCREMEIMRYPTLKYFPPFYQNESNHLGMPVPYVPTNVGGPHLFEFLANSSTMAPAWPNLQPIESTSVSDLFASLPNYVQYIFIVYDSKNESNAAQKVALDLRKIKQVQIRRVGSPAIAANLGLNVQSAVYFGQRTTKNLDLLKHLSDLNRDSVRLVVENFLKFKGIQTNEVNQHTSSTTLNPIVPPNLEVNEKNAKIIEYVKSHPDMVFQSDIETAIHYTIFHELVTYTDMTDDEFSAMFGYISILKKYSPLGDNGQRFLDALSSYIVQNEQNRAKLKGKEFTNALKALEAKYHPVFSSSHYIGCKGSSSDYRGYTCGLWQLFHYLTVSATNSDKSSDPLEVLRAIHGYVRNYFGCTECSEHFQQMAERNAMWKVTTNEEAVIWLWSAHNEVNHRLSGAEATEDPLFPKIQYPSQDTCPQCYREIIPAQSVTPLGSKTIVPHWDTSEVLYYLRRVYSLINLSRYGVDDESILPEMLSSVHTSKLQAATNSGHSSIFSEIDVRMGILLYAFCMLIIIVAVKLFLQRGYRKKVYTHDFWGKI